MTGGKLVGGGRRSFFLGLIHLTALSGACGAGAAPMRAGADSRSKDRRSTICLEPAGSVLAADGHATGGGVSGELQGKSLGRRRV